MSKYATSFSMGFAAAIFVGATLLMVLPRAEASEPSLGDWVRMSPDAKLVHAHNIEVGNGERAREMLFCLHDFAAAQTGDARALSLGEAVHLCKARAVLAHG